MRSIFKDSPGMGSIPPQKLLKVVKVATVEIFEVVKGGIGSIVHHPIGREKYRLSGLCLVMSK